MPPYTLAPTHDRLRSDLACQEAAHALPARKRLMRDAAPPMTPEGVTAHGRAGTLLRRLVCAAMACACLLVTVWGVLALWFRLPAVPAAILGALLGLSGIAACWMLLRRRQTRASYTAFAVFAAALLLLGFWWQSITPSHERPWADDVARLLESNIEGERVTLHNVRNFAWRSETDYTPRWETRQYDLRQLQSADLILSYWMGPHIAHTLVSFGFADGQRLVFSLEIRKERQEAFSAVGGFFRQFEQVMIAADESDIVKTRTNARGEQVYLYPVKITKTQLRTLFLAYLEQARQLREAPSFYNTLTSNCTTIIFELARQIAPGLPLDYRLLLSGHFAEYAQEQGALVSRLPFRQLMKASHINARAQQADGANAGDFSRAIRVGLPGAAAETER